MDYVPESGKIWVFGCGQFNIWVVQSWEFGELWLLNLVNLKGFEGIIYYMVWINSFVFSFFSHPLLFMCIYFATCLYFKIIGLSIGVDVCDKWLIIIVLEQSWSILFLIVNWTFPLLELNRWQMLDLIQKRLFSGSFHFGMRCVACVTIVVQNCWNWRKRTNRRMRIL